MNFEVVGDITEVETIAVGTSIRELRPSGVPMGPVAGGSARATHKCGSRMVRSIRKVHWYEAHGVSRVEMEIKRFLDD